MPSFFGTDTYAIDNKGRVSIPAAMRRGRGSKAIMRFVLNRGFDGCIAVYSQDEWQRKMVQLRRISDGEETARRFKHAFLADVKEVTVDAQGRIPLTPALMRHAALGKDAVLHGAEDHVEIWDPERFRAWMAPVTEVAGEYEKLAALHLKGETS